MVVTPNQEFVTKTGDMTYAPYVRRHESKRAWNGDWSWPRHLSLLVKEDLDTLPNDIKKEIYKYLRQSINWS